MTAHPDNVVEEIVAMAGRGVSRREIAAHHGLSRSAVCGVLFRRGFVAPAKIKTDAPARRGRVFGTVPKTAVGGNVPTTKAVLGSVPNSTASGAGVSWDALDSARQCCWPLASGYWCGAVKAAGPYCSDHYRAAHQAR